jgi:hypothetical protein
VAEAGGEADERDTERDRERQTHIKAGGEADPTDVLVDGEASQEADTEPAKGVDESAPAGP